MSNILRNILQVFSNWRYSIFFILFLLLMIFFFELVTDDLLIKGNMGLGYFYVNFGSQIAISVLFSSFLTFFMYKYIQFSSYDMKSSSTSVIGTFFGILVAGCPACSISIASYIGLGAAVSFLPYAGLELKLLGILMLLYANYSTLKSLNTCMVKFNKK